MLGVAADAESVVCAEVCTVRTAGPKLWRPADGEVRLRCLQQASSLGVQTSADSPAPASRLPEDDALLAFLGGGPLDGDELAFLGYRLLLAAPFPAVVARRYGFLASASVGGLLEAVRAQDVRPLCESWAAWADARLRGIAAAWKAALAAHL